jgi:hypothetical protein
MEQTRQVGGVRPIMDGPIGQMDTARQSPIRSHGFAALPP